MTFFKYIGIYLIKKIRLNILYSLERQNFYVKNSQIVCKSQIESICSISNKKITA